MRSVYTKRFLDSYASAPPHIQRAVDRRVALLLQNLRHPSLRAKKYDEARDIWQARVNGFHTRCPIRVPSCSENEQYLKEIASGHWVACQVRA